MKLDYNEKVARKLWDNYYIPYIKGYFTASGVFRTDDIKQEILLVMLDRVLQQLIFLKP